VIHYLCIIQARLGSTRFPNKVMETVGGVPMVKRVWLAAKRSWADKVVVAWPERYPDVDENNVLERFKRIINEFQPRYVIRLTADCPMLSVMDINTAINCFEQGDRRYYNNHLDGHDVQIFDPYNCSRRFDIEHIIDDIPNTGGFSVNTRKDLEMVRTLYAR
jgi:spore coat polysaccharide biosynthesis protein SpsF (cytidylyltransferase family)